MRETPENQELLQEINQLRLEIQNLKLKISDHENRIGGSSSSSSSGISTHGNEYHSPNFHSTTNDINIASGDSIQFEDGDKAVDTIKDEDDMASDDENALCTQQSIKQFVDNHNWLEADITDLGSYLENLVEDTTPQLGGDLDLNGNNIDFPTTSDISDCIDDDTMATATDKKLATSESIKAYIDSQIHRDINVYSTTNGDTVEVGTNDPGEAICSITFTPESASSDIVIQGQVSMSPDGSGYMAVGLSDGTNTLEIDSEDVYSLAYYDSLKPDNAVILWHGNLAAEEVTIYLMVVTAGQGGDVDAGASQLIITEYVP